MLNFNVKKNVKLIELVSSPINYGLYMIKASLFYIKTYKNFFYVIKKKYNKQFPINAILRNGEKIMLNYEFEALSIAHGYKNSFKIKDKKLILKNDKIKLFI